MNWNIQTDLPLWLIPIGIGLVILLAWLSYYTPKAKQLFPKWARAVLIILRSLTLLTIFLLFLGPRIINRIPNKIKPLFILAVDNSSSMAVSDSLLGSQEKITDKVSYIRSALQEKFEVHTYLFGDDVEETDLPDFSDKATDFSILFEELTVKHHTDPVNSMLILSDGIFNQGASPKYSADIFPFTVHTMALGDTTRIPDLLISSLTANELVYKDTRFPVEMLFESWNLTDRYPRVRVSSGRNVVLDTVAEFYPDENIGLLRFNLNASEPGIQNFNIRINGVDEESNLTNNSYSLTVEVVEHKAKVLILYAAPHPDISAISSAIGEMEQFEIVSSDINTFTERLNNYELIIFHQLPVRNSPVSRRLLAEYKREQIPAWFILGGQTDLRALNQMGLGIRFEDLSGLTEDLQGTINSDFSLFKIDELLADNLKEWPPLKGPFSPVRLSSRTEVLMYQSIKGIDLGYPLLCFSKTRSGKNGFLLGEGLWRWRLAEYLESAGAVQLNSLIKRVVQYLVIEENKEQFRLHIPKTLTETDRLIIRSQVYNESYENLEGMVVEFKLIDSTGAVSEYEMSSSYAGYILDLDPLSPGVYNYSAETIIGQDKFKKQGRIHIQDVRLEDLNVRADFNVMKYLADNKNGRFFTINQYDDLLNFVSDLEPGDESVRIESKWINLLHVKYLLFFIVFLLTMEWLLRRWFGTR